MGEVDREELAKWWKGMGILIQEYGRIISRITEAWENGIDDYKGVCMEGELPALLERLREMPIPNESGCKRAQKSFEKGVDAQIKARAIAVKYAGGAVPDRIWKPQMVFQLSVSESLIKNMFNDIDSLRKKYLK
jgi:hypothetical protein